MQPFPDNHAVSIILSLHDTRSFFYFPYVLLAEYEVTSYTSAWGGNGHSTINRSVVNDTGSTTMNLDENDLVEPGITEEYMSANVTTANGVISLPLASDRGEIVTC